MRTRIEAHDLPGRHSSEHRDVHVGVQRRGRSEDVLDPVPADVATATWEFEATTTVGAAGIDVRGPYVQGGPGARFVYLSWGTVEEGAFTMFGRSKLLLAEVGQNTLAAAVGSGMLVGSVSVLDERGKLRMAAVKPPAITLVGGLTQSINWRSRTRAARRSPPRKPAVLDPCCHISPRSRPRVCWVTSHDGACLLLLRRRGWMPSEDLSRRRRAAAMP